MDTTTFLLYKYAKLNLLISTHSKIYAAKHLAKLLHGQIHFLEIIKDWFRKSIYWLKLLVIIFLRFQSITYECPLFYFFPIYFLFFSLIHGFSQPFVPYCFKFKCFIFTCSDSETFKLFNLYHLWLSLGYDVIVS